MMIIFKNKSIANSSKSYRFDLSLCFLDQVKTEINIFLNLYKFFLMFLNSTLILGKSIGNKRVNPEGRSQIKQSNTCLIQLLAQTTNKVAYDKQNSNSKSEKIIQKILSKVVVAASLVKLFAKHNFGKGFFMAITLFQHLIVSVGRGVFGCLFGSGYGFEASLVNFNIRRCCE